MWFGSMFAAKVARLLGPHRSRGSAGRSREGGSRELQQCIPALANDLVIHAVGAHDLVELLKPEMAWRNVTGSGSSFTSTTRNP